MLVATSQSFVMMEHRAERHLLGTNLALVNDHSKTLSAKKSPVDSGTSKLDMMTSFEVVAFNNKTTKSLT